jgi:hypothetical protein
MQDLKRSKSYRHFFRLVQNLRNFHHSIHGEVDEVTYDLNSVVATTTVVLLTIVMPIYLYSLDVVPAFQYDEEISFVVAKTEVHLAALIEHETPRCG